MEGLLPTGLPRLVFKSSLIIEIFLKQISVFDKATPNYSQGIERRTFGFMSRMPLGFLRF